MKYLEAKRDFGYTKKPVCLSDIMISETESILENRWAVFPRHIELSYSIGRNGLDKPVVLKAKGVKYQMTFGGNRLKVAELLGVTHIDAIVVKTDAEVKTLHDLMIELPPHEGKSVADGGKHP